MRRLYALIVMLLSLALAGGAQACVAVCNPGKQPAERVTKCCKSKAPEKSKAPSPEKKCPTCTSGGQDRMGAQKAVTLDAPGLSGSVEAIVEVMGDAGLVVGVEGVGCHGPPGERLHRYCLLLI